MDTSCAPEEEEEDDDDDIRVVGIQRYRTLPGHEAPLIPAKRRRIDILQLPAPGPDDPFCQVCQQVFKNFEISPGEETFRERHNFSSRSVELSTQNKKLLPSCWLEN